MMRAVAVVATFAIWACGPIDQSGNPGSGAGNAGADGGVPADGGTISGGSGGGAGPGGAGAGAGAPLADCTGVMPGPLAAPVTATVPHGGGDVCWNATSDLSGNVAAESHPGSMGNAWTGRWHVWSADGHDRGDFSDVGGDVFGQQEGFESTQHDALVFWSATGSEVRRTALDDGCTAQAFPSATNGSLVLLQCNGTIRVRRFDGAGNLAASGDAGTGGAAAAVIDAQGRALVVSAQGNGPYAARWFDANLAPASATFQLGAPGASQPVVRPLVGGGAAVQVDGNWVAAVRSGVASADPAPAWLASHANFDLQLIRGGNAYALIPRAGATPHNALDLVAGNGDRCGSVTFAADGLSMGPDGTVIGSSGDSGCTHAWWSALLR